MVWDKHRKIEGVVYSIRNYVSLHQAGLLVHLNSDPDTVLRSIPSA
jgi:hypothetical protein